MKRLSDCFWELIIYGLYFPQKVRREDFPLERVRQEILGLMEASARCAEEANLARGDYDLARFAICAWLDELILNSDWAHRTEWQKELLQRKFYQTTKAGEEFFEKLNSLGPHQQQVREIFYLCLALGFKGRYCRPEDAYLLDQLKTSHLKLLLGSSVGLPKLSATVLFPEAYQWKDVPTEAPRKSGFSPLTLGLLTAPVVLLVVLYLVFSFVLGGVSENVLGLLP